MNLKRFSINSRSSRRRWFYPLISVVLALSISLGTAAPSLAIPWFDLILRGVQVIQLSNISPREEVQIGKQINQQLIQSGQVQLYRNSQVNSYVNKIGQRLVAASDRPNIPFTFQVARDESVNAFATTGGYVYVTTGLLKEAENEAELASVIAHEIGHITDGDLLKQMRQRAIASGLATAAGVNRNTAVSIGVELALQRPRSRQDEFEADRIGLETLARAGYPPSAMVSFMQKLLRQRSIPTFLSTHPATSDRIAALERAIDSQQNNSNYGLDTAAYRANIRPLL